MMRRSADKRITPGSRIGAALAAVLLFAIAAVWAIQMAYAAEMTPIGDPDAAPPDIKASSAGIYSTQLDSLVYGKDPDEKMSPYSITKILTCWLALEMLGEDDIVTVSAEATAVYENGTTIYLKQGEKISVLDLVYGAMLASGNDAAYALGEAVAGSEADFAALMNETVRGWGCTDTHFVNANGWKDEEHYTTARDMCVIAARCFENERLREISGTKKYTIPATNLSSERSLQNYMLMVMEDADGITAGKTGSWSDDDCSIAIAFSRDGLDAVIVLLGDTKKSRAKDAKALMEFAREVTPGFIVSSEGDAVTTARVKHGERTRTQLAVDGTTYAYPESNRTKDIEVRMEVDSLEAPIEPGDPAGRYLVYVDGELIAEHGLVVTEQIGTGWLPSYIYISNKATVRILTVAAALLIIISLLRMYVARSRRKRRAAYMERRRKRIEEEAKAQMRAESRSREDGEYRPRH